VAAITAAALALAPMPLWMLLTLLSIFALGMGTAFPVSTVSSQNAVSRSQVGTITGATNFFRALMASFTVAVFSAILLAALGPDVSLSGEQHGAVSLIPAADMIAAFRYVFGAAAAMMVVAAICMGLMEERPLAGPAQRVELAE
jgi:MFS family permease